MDQEGVIKFQLDFQKSKPFPRTILGNLVEWRNQLFAMGLIGQDPSRYGGAAYGCASRRAPSNLASRGPNQFLVTGTQTGTRAQLGPSGFSLVTRCSALENRVTALGPAPPSSESMTLGTLYELEPTIQFVFHVHSRVLWKAAKWLGIASTPRRVPYGTPEMAQAVARLLRNQRLQKQKLFVMEGHEDGLVSFGCTGEEAMLALLVPLAKAHARVRP